MMTSLTSELTIVPNAAPMMMPTAMSSTLPRMANSLNSLSMVAVLRRAASAAPGSLYHTRRSDRGRKTIQLNGIDTRKGVVTSAAPCGRGRGSSDPAGDAYAAWIRAQMMRAWGLAAVLAVSMSAAVVSGDDAQRLLGVDHFVRVTSTVPAIAGQPAQLYVRERVLAGTALRGSSFDERVVLFVHGAAPGGGVVRRAVQDYSWMGSRARRVRRLLGGHDRVRALTRPFR